MRLCSPARTWLALASPRAAERRHSRIAAANIADAIVEIVERAAGPEHVLEIVGAGLQPAQPQQLLDDDRPAPERGHDQEHDHRLPDQVRVQEKTQESQVDDGLGPGDDGGIHGSVHDL
jgi:hypothetical protein